MKILGVIPSRYASSRFPGKPLIDIGGKSMIQRVYEQALQSSHLNDLVVATDDDRICQHIKAMGGKVMMTSSQHTNGTERCGEVLEKASGEYDFVINIQGDEPFISPAQIDLLASQLTTEVELATQVKFVSDWELFDDPHEIKVVFSRQGEALYFSRSAIPLPKNREDFRGFYKHIGIYAYRADVLQDIVKLPASQLERQESLEQLRWLENGYSIRVVETFEESYSIDTPEDLARVVEQKLVI